MKKLKLTTQSGLTLVEALVAITVLIVGVLGPLTIAARGIGDGLFARNQMAASYLAQEAIEMVVNQRMAIADYYAGVGMQSTETIFTADFTVNSGTPNPFLTCINHTKDNIEDDDGNKYCSVVPSAADDEVAILANCDNAVDKDCQLAFDDGTNLYQTTESASGTRTGPEFTRLVEMEFPDDDDESKVKVIVTVRWYNKAIQKELKLVEHLFSLN